MVAEGPADVGVQGRGRAERLQDWIYYRSKLPMGHLLEFGEEAGFAKAKLADKADSGAVRIHSRMVQ